MVYDSGRNEPLASRGYVTDDVVGVDNGRCHKGRASDDHGMLYDNLGKDGNDYGKSTLRRGDQENVVFHGSGTKSHYRGQKKKETREVQE